MSTILEWARRSLDGTATQVIVADSTPTNGVKGDVPYHKQYDHLLPKESDAIVANGCSDVKVTTLIDDIIKNGATSVMQDESGYQNSISVIQLVAEEAV